VQKSESAASICWSAVVAELAVPCRAVAVQPRKQRAFCQQDAIRFVRENKCILLFKKWQRVSKNLEQFISEYNNKNTFSGI
jgi:hypothetical protein